MKSIYSWNETLRSIHDWKNHWMHSWKSNPIRLRADYIGMTQCIAIIEYWLYGGIMCNFRPLHIIDTSRNFDGKGKRGGEKKEKVLAYC